MSELCFAPSLRAERPKRYGEVGEDVRSGETASEWEGGIVSKRGWV